MIEDEEAVEWLKEFYAAGSDKELVRKVYDDWRICFPSDIADEDGSIPRNPVVLMRDDPNWFHLADLPESLQEFINAS